MQKAYSRINWENEPSENTPLGANNLNKVDMALNTIDDRVLSLYGYEGRVAVSEQNAKTSEQNAKASADNAKQSELLAKQYADRAFSGTPEGYDKLVEDVRLMDIKQTTDTTLSNSKEGGYKLVSMSGNSVQNGTPTPETPISINNVGDCVEMMQGGYSSSTGAWASNGGYVCSKNLIPCKSGDVVKVTVGGTTDGVMLTYYNDSGFSSYGWIEGVKAEYSFTIPSGITKFALNVRNVSGITLDTVGKISLTINGKYVVQIVELGEDVALNITKENGYLDSTGAIVSFEGWSHKIVEINSRYDYLISGGTLGSSPKHCLYDSNMRFISYFETNNNDILVTPPISAKYLGISFQSRSNPSVQIQKVATVLLNEPLRDTDVMSRTEVARKRASVVFDGSETWYMGNGYFYIKVENGAYTKDVLSTHYKNDNSLSTTNHGNIWINTASQLIVVDTRFTSVGDFKAWLVENNVTVEYELAEPIIEELDNESKIALNSLETFDTVTYINVDSRVKPSEIVSEYGTSKVGAITLKNELKNDTLEIKYNELAVALLSVGSEV